MGCFGGDFNIDNGLLLSFSCKLSDLLSDKFSGLCMQPRKTRPQSSCEGGSDPENFLGGSGPKKWGRSRPIWCFFRCHFLILVSFISSSSRELSAHKGEEGGEDEAEVRNSYLLHLLCPNSRRAPKETSCWAGATHDSHWPRNRVRKWGRSSPTQGFARVQIDRRAMRNLLFLGQLLGRQGDSEGDA